MSIFISFSPALGRDTELRAFQKDRFTRVGSLTLHGTTSDFSQTNAAGGRRELSCRGFLIAAGFSDTGNRLRNRKRCSVIRTSHFWDATMTASIRLAYENAGLTVIDYRCTANPDDRQFEEVHEKFCLALVRKGSFGCRALGGTFELTPGSFFIGYPGDTFTCTHDHHQGGDECLSFEFRPEIIEDVGTQPGVWRRVAMPALAETGGSRNARRIRASTASTSLHRSLSPTRRNLINVQVKVDDQNRFSAGLCPASIRCSLERRVGP